jgi:hypothetical protein
MHGLPSKCVDGTSKVENATAIRLLGEIWRDGSDGYHPLDAAQYGWSFDFAPVQRCMAPFRPGISLGRDTLILIGVNGTKHYIPK